MNYKLKYIKSVNKIVEIKWDVLANGLCWWCNPLGDIVDTTKKNAGTLIDTSKEVCLEVITEKTKYMLLSCHQISDKIMTWS
jgi:hypothetical protein